MLSFLSSLFIVRSLFQLLINLGSVTSRVLDGHLSRGAILWMVLVFNMLAVPMAFAGESKPLRTSEIPVLNGTEYKQFAMAFGCLVAAADLSVSAFIKLCEKGEDLTNTTGDKTISTPTKMKKKQGGAN